VLDQILIPAVQKTLCQRGSRFRRLSVWRSRNAPPSELIVPPSNRATISRLPQASNPKFDWLHSVIAKAVPFLALTVVWKLSYATKNGLLPIVCEICGLNHSLIGFRLAKSYQPAEPSSDNSRAQAADFFTASHGHGSETNPF
jgi:hypothetical protein